MHTPKRGNNNIKKGGSIKGYINVSHKNNLYNQKEEVEKTTHLHKNKKGVNTLVQ